MKQASERTREWPATKLIASKFRANQKRVVVAGVLSPIVTLVLTLSLNGCGSSNGGPVQFKAPLRGGGTGGGGGGGFSGKPVPPLSDTDRLTAVFQELTRGAHSLHNLISVPDGSAGCITYHPIGKAKDHGVFLTAEYNNCKFAQSQSTSKVPLEFSVSGVETFQKFAAVKGVKPESAQASSQLSVDVYTGNPRAKIGKTTLNRTITASVEDTQGSSTQYLVSMSGMWGKNEATGSDFWDSNMESSRWIAKNTKDGLSLTLDDGSVMQWSYREAIPKKARAADPYELTITALEPIEFSKGCPWPAKGLVRWNEKHADKSSSGEVTLQADGYVDQKGQKTLWPQSHCLERR